MAGKTTDQARPLAAQPPCAIPSQCGRGGAGQQAGAYSLGDLASQDAVQKRTGHPGAIERKGQTDDHEKIDNFCEWKLEDGRTVDQQTGYLIKIMSS